MPLGTSAAVGAYQPGQLPNVLGNLFGVGTFTSGCSGAFVCEREGGSTLNNGTNRDFTHILLDASAYNSIYGNYASVVTSGIYTKYIIKF